MIHPAGSAPTTGATGAAAPDAGVATVWAAAAVAVLTIVLVACLHLGAALLARHRAESAADLAALAAAREAVRGEVPACLRAAQIATATGGEVCGAAWWDGPRWSRSRCRCRSRCPASRRRADGPLRDL